MRRVAVQAEAFDEGAELAALRLAGVGGIASFTGIVRGGAGLTALTLEHYPGMTEAALRALAEAAAQRWSLRAVSVIHRVGTLAPGAPIVFVGTAAPHRRDALDACAFLIDRLKTDAPFWKSETFADGHAQWVDARASDTDSAARWD